MENGRPTSTLHHTTCKRSCITASSRCACHHSGVSFWIEYQDFREDRYLRPLPEARCCPLCGQALKRAGGQR